MRPVILKKNLILLIRVFCSSFSAKKKWYERNCTVARLEEKRNAYRVLVGKPEGKNH
jgi:hypothetical protein